MAHEILFNLLVAHEIQAGAIRFSVVECVGLCKPETSFYSTVRGQVNYMGIILNL